MYKVKLGRREQCLATVHTAFAAVGAAFASFFGDETAAECRQTDLVLSFELACWPRRKRENVYLTTVEEEEEVSKAQE